MEPASLAGDELRVKAAKYFSDDPDFLRIITNAKVNVATLFNSQTLIREIVKKKDWEALSRFLMDAWKISNTEDSKKRQQTRSDEYDIRVINSDISPELLDRMAMKAHMSHSPWKLLIAGASGTGKSAYAYHLANKLDMEILVKRPQDVIFRYFGESETAIANAFREAESKNALLLFDENVLHTFFRADDAVVAERPDDYDRKCFDPALQSVLMITIVSASIQPMGKVSISIHACLSVSFVIMPRDGVLSFPDFFVIKVLFFIHPFQMSAGCAFIRKAK